MRATVRVPKPRWRCWISRRCWRWRIVTLWPPPSSGWLWLGESRERRQGLRRWRGRGRLSRPKLSPAEREDTRLPHLVRGHQETHSLTIPYSRSTNKTLALNKVLLFFCKFTMKWQNAWSTWTRHCRRQQNLDLIGMKPSCEVESQWSQGSVKGGKYSNV